MFVSTVPFDALLKGCCDTGKILAANVLLETMSERYVVICLYWNILIIWLRENEKAYARLGRMLKFLVVLGYATYQTFMVYVQK